MSGATIFTNLTLFILLYLTFNNSAYPYITPFDTIRPIRPILILMSNLKHFTLFWDKNLQRKRNLIKIQQYAKFLSEINDFISSDVFFSVDTVNACNSSSVAWRVPSWGPRSAGSIPVAGLIFTWSANICPHVFCGCGICFR